MSATRVDVEPAGYQMESAVCKPFRRSTCARKRAGVAEQLLESRSGRAVATYECGRSVLSLPAFGRRRFHGRGPPRADNGNRLDNTIVFPKFGLNDGTAKLDVR